MNKRKLIYFLSAFVLIIGCYALNLSYSLFTQNITSKNNVVDTSIPLLSARLETNTYTIPANNGEVVTLKILNSGTANIQYGISINELPEGINAYLVEKEDNDIVGKVEASQSKEVLVYLENTTENESTITFNLDAKYETVSFDKTTFISNSNIDCVNKVKSLSESILARATSTEITDETKTVYDESFNSGNITGVSGETERKLIKVEDDYGTSYVYRGSVKDNYVNFAGFKWRIVRINGDGTIRLILDGTIDMMNAGTKSEYNVDYDNNAYIGYMYGLALSNNANVNQNRCLKLSGNSVIDDIVNNSTKEFCENSGGKWTTNSYEATHANVKDSTLKTNIDKFYETYIENDENNRHSEKYLADVIFCNDKSLASDGIDGISTQYGFGNNNTIYAAYQRIYINQGTTINSVANINLKCASGENNDYSRMTAGNLAGQNRFDINNNLLNGVKINNDLKYPIALLSADELVLAGAWAGTGTTINQSYYLNDSYKDGFSQSEWWLGSPIFMNEYASYVYKMSSEGVSISGHGVGSSFGVRPVINLKANVVIESGDGTKNTTFDEEGNILTGPYSIKLFDNEKITLTINGDNFIVPKGSTYERLVTLYPANFGLFNAGTIVMYKNSNCTFNKNDIMTDEVITCETT